MKWAFYFFLISFLLPACSHLNTTCKAINWYELGRQDSAKGLKKSSIFEKRRKVCPISPNSIYAKAYDNGFSAGLRDYCSFKTGYIYSLSQMKRELVSACPENLKIEFIKGYEIGSYMKEIQSLQNEIQDKIQRVAKKLVSMANKK